MKSISHFNLALLLASIAFLTTGIGCTDREIRGVSTPSKDGSTYLVLLDDNGGKCGPLKIDGRIWPYPLRQPGQIAPGLHKIQCGDSGEIEFEIKQGQTFQFDYWGP